MTSHRRIFLTGAIAASLLMGMPTLAAASSLLSGYGGPGQGSQAILGSTLVGGSGGGGGGSGSVGGGPEAGYSAAGVTSAGGNGTHSGAGGESSSQPSGGASVSYGKASDGVVRAYPAALVERAYVARAGGSRTLGLSGDDLLYVLLALAALIYTGVLTRQLAQTQGSGAHRRLKVRVARPE